ncbi:Lrp/AsnC family transcriptional regulator, partial [Motilibacter deserti]
GVIRGFTAVVDSAVLGWTTEAYVEVFCAGNVSPDSLRASLDSIPEVVDACTVTGEADALVHLRAVDIRHMETVLERVRSDRRVGSTKSVIVLSHLVDRPPA